MVKIAFAIMLIFIATTNCALKDCSKDELVGIAIEANHAYKVALGLPPIGLQNYDDLHESELKEEIQQDIFWYYSAKGANYEGYEKTKYKYTVRSI